MRRDLHTGRKKLYACMISLLLLLAVYVSSLYVTQELGHDCQSEECPVCSCLHVCEHILQRFGTAPDPQILSLVPLTASLLLLPCLKAVLVKETLVSRKVRLDD